MAGIVISSRSSGRVAVVAVEEGALFNGVTDDRPALQSMLDWIEARGGGELLLPGQGVGMLGDFLRVGNYTTISAEGGMATLCLLANRPFRTNLPPPTDPDFNACITNKDHVNGNHHIRLIGLRLDGNYLNQVKESGGRGANLLPLQFYQVSFWEVADCELLGGISECFYALGGCVSPNFTTTHGILANCWIHDTGYEDEDSLGFHGDRVDGVAVTGCTFQNIGLRAIGFSKGTNVAVAGCTAINCQDAILLGGTRKASFTGITAVDVRNDGILIDQSVDEQVPLDVVVAGCTFTAKAGNTGHGLHIKKGNFITVAGVTVNGFLSDGFLLETGECVLQAVVAANCSGYGVHLNGAGAIHNSVGPYHAFGCAGEELEDGGAGSNRWFAKHTRIENLTLSALAGGAGPAFIDPYGQVHVDDIVLTQPYISGQLPIANGGTGADNAAGARWMLDVYSKGEVDAAITAALAAYVTAATYNAHGHWFGVPAHPHSGVTIGAGNTADGGAYGAKTGGPY